MNIKPLSDLIIIRPDPSEEISAGGIVLAPSAQEEAKHGTVLAIGPGKLHENGYLEPMDLKPGDRVAFSMYAKETFKHNGETLLTCHQTDIIGVIE
jgi:chaperonin GroES